MIPITLLGFCITLQIASLVLGVYLLRGSFWRNVWLAFDVILVLIGLRRSLLIISALSDVAAGDLAPHAAMQDLIALAVLSVTLFSGIFIIHFMFRSMEKAEAVLRENEEKYHNIFKDSRDSLTLLDASTGHFVTWNPAALNMFKIDAEALASSSPSDLSPPYQPDGRPSDEKAREMIGIALETGSHFFEWVHKRFTGEEFFATVLLTRIEANDNVLIQATVRDITEQKLAEAALRESEARYNQLAALSRTITWEVDATGLCAYISDVVTDVLGYRPDELVGKRHCYDLGYAPPGVNLMERNLELLASKKPFLNMENQMLHKDGHPVWIVSNGMPILDANGDLLGYRGMDTDITEQKRLEEEKQQLQEQFVHAQKMESVGRLAGGIAHDFNNKLGVILGYLELAQKQAGDNASLRETLDKINAAANNAASLTRQILAFARKQTVAPRQINLNESTENMLVMLQKLIGEGVSTTWIPGSAAAWVKIDPAQIDQILTNLLLNARDAISENGSITIETSDEIIDEAYCAAHAEAAPGRYVALSVSDDGCGMDRKTLSHIFEPFFTTKDVGKGTGLGLPTVYGIVKQNSGFINVYSEPGRGTTFRIYLPRCAVPCDGAPALQEGTGAAGGQETILVVEDEEDLLELCKIMLESLGYRILQAAGAEEAVQVASNHDGAIHLLMTDVVMPTMNGRELAQALIAEHPDMKVLFMSGYTADAIVHQGVLNDGVSFIQKPFSTESLAAGVRNALQKA